MAEHNKKSDPEPGSVSAVARPVQRSNSGLRIVYFLLSLLLVTASTVIYHSLEKYSRHLRDHFVLFSSLILPLLLAHYVTNRPRKIYLVDFACYKPGPELMASMETFMERSALLGTFTEESLRFQKKVLERSGLGPKTYAAPALLHGEKAPTLEEAMEEAEAVVFGAVDELLEKSGVKGEDIGIVIANCSLFDPAPSLSAMVVNRYKLRGNVKSYSLAGMGCSAGLISIDLAKQLLQVNLL